MEQYLKDSPSDSNNAYDGNENNADTYNNNFNFNFDSTNNTNYNANLDTLGEVGGNKNFSLNLEQPVQATNDEFDSGQYPTFPGAEFLTPANDNEYVSSIKSDPYLEDFDHLNYPNDNLTANPQQTANLDEIISPHNNIGGLSDMNNQPFLDSQYFSPPGKQGINLNSLGNNSFSNTFSPDASRQGSVSVPFQNTNNYDINSGSYLSPQATSFMSPGGTNFENSLDTLRSPNQGSYLNSPPRYDFNGRNISDNITSTSIPNTINKFLSPPTSAGTLGTSAPSGNPQSSGPKHVLSGTPARQLTQEEKLQRRREFHNAVERRRRDLIKERIKELGVLVPPSLLNPQLVAVQTYQKNQKLNTKEISDLLGSVKVKESKPNKSTILNKSVDYIEHLQYVLKQQEKARVELELKLQSLSLGDNMNTTQEAPSRQNPNFLEDFQNQQHDQDNFDPDEFFLEIITGNGQNSFQ